MPVLPLSWIEIQWLIYEFSIYILHEILKAESHVPIPFALKCYIFEKHGTGNIYCKVIEYIPGGFTTLPFIEFYTFFNFFLFWTVWLCSPLLTWICFFASVLLVAESKWIWSGVHSRSWLSICEFRPSVQGNLSSWWIFLSSFN